MKTCEACGGSGICPDCKGEGFVVKRLSDESAERARMTAKNMATRYTAAYILLSPYLSSRIRMNRLKSLLTSFFFCYCCHF